MDLGEDVGPALIVEVEPREIGKSLAALPYLRRSEGRVRTQCWIHGVREGERIPIYFREVALAHALELVLNSLSTEISTAPMSTDLISIEIKAGDGKADRRLHAWYARGD